MCWDFIFDWFSLCYFTFLYILLFHFILSAFAFAVVVDVVVLAHEPIPPPVVVVSYSCTLFSVPLFCVLSLVRSLFLSLSLFWSFSFCYVFLLLLRFVVSFVVCFVRVLFVAVLLSLPSLTHVFYFCGPVIRYTLTHQVACSPSLSLSFVLLPVLLTVCALCLLLLPLRSQGQVNERFDFFVILCLTFFFTFCCCCCR